MGKLDGKVAIVTGGAFGNGRGMAVRFAEEGADGGSTAGIDSAMVAQMVEQARQG